MSDRTFFERLKVGFARIWPWPLATAVVSAALGAAAVRVLSPRLDYDDEIRKIATARVMQDVRESKGFTEEAGREFQAKIDEYHVKRRKRDDIVLNASLSSLEKVAKVEKLEGGLIEAERGIYQHPLAATANRRSIFLEYVLNKSIGTAPVRVQSAAATEAP